MPRPDLSGTYDIATLTPLERHSLFGDTLSIGLDDPRAPRLTAAKAGQGERFFQLTHDFGAEPTLIDGRIRTSIITSPVDGKLPGLSLEAQAALEARVEGVKKDSSTAWWIDDPVGPFDGPESRPLAERCLLGISSTAGPPALPVIYNNLKRIVQTERYVLISNEMIHDARVIRIDSTHLPETVRKWMGDSIGWWEGETLVVDTTNFRDESGLLPAGEDLHVVERFTPLEEGDVLYQFVVDDPAWTEPWEGEYVWSDTDEHIYEYACHEANYSLAGMLKGARRLEREALTFPPRR